MHLEYEYYESRISNQPKRRSPANAASPEPKKQPGASQSLGSLPGEEV